MQRMQALDHYLGPSCVDLRWIALVEDEQAHFAQVWAVQLSVVLELPSRVVWAPNFVMTLDLRYKTNRGWLLYQHHLRASSTLASLQRKGRQVVLVVLLTELLPRFGHYYSVLCFQELVVLVLPGSWAHLELLERPRVVMAQSLLKSFPQLEPTDRS